jgi:protein TonB
MSYLEQTGRKNPASVAAVVGVHLAVGYALLTGLGYVVVPHIRGTTTVVNVPTEPPPPPPKPVERATKPTANALPQPQPREDTFKADPIIPKPVFDIGPVGMPDGGGTGEVAPPPQPPKPSLARDATPGKGRLGWITTDDYPPGLIRQNVQGLVVISVMIGTDGAVRSCLVTQSSGNKLLDDTTCRLYTKRAHFSPALDADGNPTTAQRTDRYRWQIPNE